MLYALKGNRQIKIDETEKDSFESKGFDVFKEDDGKLVLLTKKSDPKADARLIKSLEKENAELKAKVREVEVKK